MKLWMKTLLVAPIGALLLGFATPAAADPGYRAKAWDRWEDRLDRWENRIDRRVDNGVWDRREDRWDRREDRWDRNHGPRASRFSSRLDRRWDRRERRANRFWRRH